MGPLTVWRSGSVCGVTPRTNAEDVFEFLTHEPGGELGRLVETFWFARGHAPAAREHIAPTGSTVGGIVLGDPILQTSRGRGTFRATTGFLIGPHDRPMLNEPTGRTHCYGIVTTPIGCRAVFGAEPVGMRGRVVNLADVWPLADPLRTALLEVANGAYGLDLVRRTLEGLRVPAELRVQRAESVVRHLTSDPVESIADMAARLGISHGYLDRQFTSVVGLNPRTLARILRVRRLVDQLDVAKPIDWSALALQHGWFDQAHMIRDFRRHTGVPPSTYVRAQRATYSAVELASSAGFLPEP